MSTDSIIQGRYSRQALFEGIGEAGQRLLGDSRVLILGCGALGSAQAEALARAGVGTLRIVDRDFVELSNLQRQTMFTEHDAAERLPKTIACEHHIREINSEIRIETKITDVNCSNIERLIDSCDVVLDGTDNFATRYLINDACIKHNVSWIYGAAVGAYGATMTIRPGETPCLRCLFPEIPAVASAPTCDTAGVIMPIISVVTAMQVTETLKLLTGNLQMLHNSLMQFDVWRNEWRRISVGEKLSDCPSCAFRDFKTLAPDNVEFAATLCGRDAVQISPHQPVRIDLSELGQKLRQAGEVKSNDYLLRFRTGKYELTVFQDARSIIRGTDDISTARSLYAKYIGN